jgi:hypothetical protein
MLTVALLGALAACDRRQDRSNCWTAIQESREAVAQDKLEEASSLLDHARATCGHRSPDDLRRTQELIIDRRAAKREVEQDEAARRPSRDLPIQRFISWVREPLSEFSRNLDNVECVERGNPGFGFCEAERKGSPEMEVRYWKMDPAIARYTFTAEEPSECEDLGQHRRLRRWSASEKTYELCELTEREERDQSALLVAAPGNNQMFIFSFEYVKKDPSFERMLRSR